jgi:transposase
MLLQAVTGRGVVSDGPDPTPEDEKVFSVGDEPHPTDDEVLQRIRVKGLVEGVRAAADEHTWHGSTAAVDRQVLDVHLDAAELRGRLVGGGLVYTISVREVAERAGVGEGTVSRSQRRLGWCLDRVRPADDSWQPLIPGLPAQMGQQIIWALGGPPGATQSEQSRATIRRSDCVVLNAYRQTRGWALVEKDNPETGHPTYRGLTMAKRHVWAALSPTTTTTAVDLARLFGRTRRTIERHLCRLQTEGLASRTAGGWRRSLRDLQQ